MLGWFSFQNIVRGMWVSYKYAKNAKKEQKRFWAEVEQELEEKPLQFPSFPAMKESERPCPFNAIFEKEGHFYLDRAKCIACPGCPHGAAQARQSFCGRSREDLIQLLK
ncbi:hypothetical protein AGMMS49949_04170 [Alphaproteobacteria bacterium]|nr:hypothetical protein AGMMS49949_04170 [Alphaproteobacteria bacterium]GHS97135.1 hypothetical protein AGMMS50296_3880 [Alphaproteobacteria bacterium]